jgi:hypothetical protein
MRRGEAWKPLRERGGWMQMSERVVFYVLLERADNADCTVPAFMTPSLAQLAEDCSCSKASVATALRHLEHHGWVERNRSKGGRGHKTAYRLSDGFPCGPGCDYWRPSPQTGKQSHPRSHPITPPKRSNEQTVSPPKQSNEQTEKRSNEVTQTPRSDPVSGEGLVKGEGKEGSASQPVVGSAAVAPSEGGPANGTKSLAPDRSLIRRLVRIVHKDPCGGLHREALAERLHLPARGRVMGDALGIAYRNKKIDFCGQYVVKPVPGRDPRP